MVYIIEDDMHVRMGFEILLKSAGFPSTSFESAEAFIQRFTPGTNDMLLLDMRLPGMNGCDFLKQLKHSGTFLPVIVISSMNEPSVRECARQYGAVAFLRKPVDGDALIDLIQYHSRAVNENNSP